MSVDSVLNAFLKHHDLTKNTQISSHSLTEAGQHVTGVNPFINQRCWIFGLSSGSAERREVTPQMESWGLQFKQS